VNDSTCPTLSPWVSFRLNWKYFVFSHIQMGLNSINQVF